MTIMVHPDLIHEAESTARYTQGIYANDASNKYARTLENKPALLVVTDASQNILLSIVGHTQWYSDAFATLDSSFDIGGLYLRFDESTVDQAASVRPINLAIPRTLTPYAPALRFYRLESFIDDIRQAGVAAHAYLLVDPQEGYSATDISSWPVALWDGSVAYTEGSIPASVRHLELSVGDTQSDATVRLTNTNLDPSQNVVQTADPFIPLHFTNMMGDWSGAKAELLSVIDSMPAMATTLEGVLTKEAAV